jgi:hypothetical protein
VRELPLTRLLVGLRGLARESPPPDSPMLESVRFLVPLAEAPGERVAGLVGQPWHLRPVEARIAGADDFTSFDAPGWVRAAMDLRVVPYGAGSRLSTETRVHATDAEARRRFGRYWRIVRHGSALIRRELLRAAKRRAERA